MFKVISRELKALMKNYKGVGGLVVVLCAIFTPVINGGSVFAFFTLFGGVGGIAITEIESRDKAYYSILSAPCTRTDYVYGKFVSNISWLLILAVGGWLLNMVIEMVLPGRITPLTLGMAKIVVGYILIFISIYHVLYFTLGVKWAKIGYFLCFFAIIFGVMMMDEVVFGAEAPKLATNIYDFLQSGALINNLIYFVILGGVVGLFAYISAIVYDRKDL